MLCCRRMNNSEEGFDKQAGTDVFILVFIHSDIEKALNSLPNAHFIHVNLKNLPILTPGGLSIISISQVLR